MSSAAGEASKKTENSKQQLEQVYSELVCSICHDYFVQATTLSCSHSYCLNCITSWRETHADCPVCRREIFGMAPSRALDNMVTALVNRTERAAHLDADLSQFEAWTNAAGDNQRNNGQNRSANNSTAQNPTVHIGYLAIDQSGDSSQETNYTENESYDEGDWGEPNENYDDGDSYEDDGDYYGNDGSYEEGNYVDEEEVEEYFEEDEDEYSEAEDTEDEYSVEEEEDALFSDEDTSSYYTEADDDDYDEEHARRSNQNNPNNDEYWRLRGYPERPSNWKELIGRRR